MRTVISTSTVVLIGVLIALVTWGSVAAQGFQTFPVIYVGNVTIAGAPAPEGLVVVACVRDCATGWESSIELEESGPTGLDGSYSVIVDPNDNAFVGDPITFLIVTDFGSRIQAIQSVSFDPGSPMTRTLNLTFEDPLPEPPTPTPESTPTTVPTPTATPMLPIPGDSGVLMLGRVALITGIVALVRGSAIFIAARRRKAF